MENVQLTRRGFVCGAAAGGVAALAGAAALGASEAWAEEAVAEGEGNPNVDPIAPVDPPAAWDREADVVVIGAGGGGLNAAARVAELGASVILLEKSAVTGGNSSEAGGTIVMGGARCLDEVESALPEWPFDVDAWVKWIEEVKIQGADPEMVRLVGANMGKAHDWMEDCGIEWKVLGRNTLVPANGPDSPLGTKRQLDVTNGMYEYGLSQGAEYLTSTRAVGLVYDGERVVGVKAEDEDGNDLFVRGEKGVIMCGGGFASNKDLLAKYCPEALRTCGFCYLTPSDTGDCLRMGQGLDAAVVSENCYAMFDGGMEYEKFGGEWCTYLYNGATQLVRQPWLTIDCSGQRKHYISSNTEEGMSSGGLTAHANVQTSTIGNRSYVVFDNNYEESVKNFDEKNCRRLITPGLNPVAPYIPEAYHDWHTGAEAAIESGIIAKADTLAELAEKLGLQADILENAVADWNATCEKGEDDFMYPYEPEWLIPVTEPPFYGAKLGGILFRTDTGLAINTKMQVLRNDGTVIPGLYAGWYTAAAVISNGGLKSSIKYSIGGVSQSYTGGWLCANSIMGVEE